MKPIGLFLLLTFLTANSFCQQIFHDARFAKIKQIENGYISLIKGANDNELKKFLVNKFKGYYVEGIALHDNEGKFIWVRAFDNRILFDVKFENNKVFVLNADWLNNKVNSSAVLYETVLDLNGKFLNENKISDIKSNVPNSRIQGFYDDIGQIWEWTNWEYHKSILINNLEIIGGNNNNIRITNHSIGKTYTYFIKGENLKVLTHDVYKNKIGFIISGNGIALEKDTIKINGNILLEFETSGNIINAKSIATNGVNIEHLEIINDEFFIGGSFKGNDTLKFESAVYFLEKTLKSPKNRFRDESARNGFVASLNDSLYLNWIQILKSEYDVNLETMSVLNKTIAVGLEYKDCVNINGMEIVSLKDSSEYEYSDAALILFDINGEINSVERLIGNGYEKIGAFLMDNKLILFGDFLYTMKVFDIELNDPSKNSCSFLIFKGDETIGKE